jgi:hypothetical protein
VLGLCIFGEKRNIGTFCEDNFTKLFEDVDDDTNTENSQKLDVS